MQVEAYKENSEMIGLILDHQGVGRCWVLGHERRLCYLPEAKSPVQYNFKKGRGQTPSQWSITIVDIHALLDAAEDKSISPSASVKFNSRFSCYYTY